MRAASGEPKAVVLGGLVPEMVLKITGRQAGRQAARQAARQADRQLRHEVAPGVLRSGPEMSAGVAFGERRGAGLQPQRPEFRFSLSKRTQVIMTT